MAPDDSQESPLAKALRREKELQKTIKEATDTIKSALQEIEKIKQFREMYRSFSPEAEAEKGTNEGPEPTFSRTIKSKAYGGVQTIFQSLAVDILREVGRPMNSTEFIEEFRKRGRPIGGNEVRTAWNRLWEARKNGVLAYVPKVGYWLPDEPLSDLQKERARLAAKLARKHSKAGTLVRGRKGKPKGPPPALSPEQVATAQRMMLAGRTLKEVADLFGIAIGTLTNYTGDLNEVKARNPDVVVPKRPYRPRPGFKPKGRKPMQLSAEQENQIRDLRAQGKTVQEILKITGLKRGTTYKALERLGAVKKRQTTTP